MADFHDKMMSRAISLARKGLGRTSPNPVVGCVIVKDGRIVGEGWHKKGGTPHAEIHALHQAGGLAASADVYVTLEPCAHYGKTPPCAEALIAARVRRVFVGMVDPNPKVCGKGIALLRDTGIEVVADLLHEQCRRLNEPFIKFVTTGLPFVILKSAITLDGKTATAAGDSKWITGDKARRYVHKIRAIVDGIMVGVGTICADDPQLTSRNPRGKDPTRIVVDSQLRTPLHANVLQLKSKAKTLLATCSTDAAKIERLSSSGVAVMQCQEIDKRVDLHDLFARLGQLGIQSILLEGGGELAGEALRGGFIDKVMVFIAPKLLGGAGKDIFAGSGAALMAEAFLLNHMTISTIGADILVQGYPEKPCLQA
jgi:diaminohydroxyphosphoribosylaminopyrimidine deaminase/5-amino-6-(5-phosphoribosylamino)uracil reductase